MFCRRFGLRLIDLDTTLPASVVDATSKRYLEAYRRVTGADLKVA